MKFRRICSDSNLTIDRVSIPRYEERISFVKVFIAPYISKDSVVLDAGCGPRNRLITKFEVGQLVGVDINEQALKDNHDISRGIKGNIESLSTVVGRKFDFCMSFDVIEHLQNPDKFIREVSKVLKHGAYFFFAIPNRSSFIDTITSFLPESLIKIATYIINGSPTTNKVHYYRMNRVDIICKCLKSNGFDRLHIVLLNILPGEPRRRTRTLVFYPDYLIGRSGLISSFSMRILCLARYSPKVVKA